MKGRKNGLFLAGCVLFLISSVWLAFFYMWLGQKDRMVISLDSGIYAQGTEVTVQVFRKGTIYYTMDGRDPAENGENVQEYTGPLILETTADGKAYHLCFFCQYDDGSLSEIHERNYVILGEDRQITTDYIVCIQGEDYDLFSDEEGIFVRGNQYYEYWEEHPDLDENNVIIPANYFSNKELEVHAVIFTGQGQEIVSQNCGLKIYGNVTRAKNQKSFRLIARYDYDKENEFAYIFFDHLTSDNTGSAISAYQRLSLHNAGNDNGYGFIRNTLCNEIAKQAGFPDVLVSRSASVYVNDRYMGVYWLQNDFDDKYFKEKYGSYDGEMIINEGTLSSVTIDEEKDEVVQENARAYNEFCDWLIESNVNDPEVWQRVTETIDVDNLIQYVAIEYYISNFDWPKNNVKIYRYVPIAGEEYQEGTVFDGKWRYLLFDLDYGMGLQFLGWFGRTATEESLEELLYDDTKAYAKMFTKLMEREDCRNDFITAVLNLGNGCFAPDNVNHVLEELNETRWAELEYMMGSTDILKDSLWEWDDNNIDNVIQELEEIRDFADERMPMILTEMRSIWDCGSPFQIAPEHPAESEIYVNGQPVNSDCRYFSEVPITLSLESVQGNKKATGWYINGEYIEGETVEILPQDYLWEYEVLAVEPLWEEAYKEELVIQAFSTRGHQDWVRLENTGNTIIYLSDYFLSDDEEEPLKGRLLNIPLQPGESILIYGGKYEGEMESMSYQMNFSWNSEEPVILAHLTKGILESRYR